MVTTAHTLLHSGSHYLSLRRRSLTGLCLVETSELSDVAWVQTPAGRAPSPGHHGAMPPCKAAIPYEPVLDRESPSPRYEFWILLT